MKKLNPSPRRLYFLLTVMLFAGVLPAQQEQFLNSNNVNAGIAIGGNLFSDSILVVGNTTNEKFELPKGSGKNLIFTQALWMSALDVNNSLHVAASRYFDYGRDYFDGPVANVYDSIYDRYYRRVFKVTQAEIAHFKTLAFPVNAAQVDSAILFWPAKGNPSVMGDYGVNISSPLAPFVDLNGNGIYEPLLGDYPGICGDEGIFFVYNDIRAAHTQTGGTPLGVEIRGMASAFTDSTSNIPYDKRAINNSVFVRYEIENKSQNAYNSFNVGNWMDPDIGCFMNDFAGCDSARNLLFAYNGTTTDPDCAPENGYGSLQVALGVKLLNQPLSVFGCFSGQGAPSPAVSDPITAYQYNLLLNGFWSDTTAFEYGGTGFNSGGGVTKYMFTGDLNNATQWSEVSDNDVPGDRRMYGATNTSTFSVGEIKHFDYVFYGSYDSTSNHIGIVDTLKRDADILQNFYQNTIVPCQVQFTTAINNIEPQLAVSIYPNPAHNLVTISTSDYMKSVELMDIQGRLLSTQIVGAKTTTLPVSNLAKGVYLVNIQCVGGSVVRRIVVE